VIYGDARISEKQKAMEFAAYALKRRDANKRSKLWRMRVRQALRRLEELYDVGKSNR
jgi:hypothetical protein